MSDIQSLNAMVENNEYPILFFGSGISKRYNQKFPSWEELLEEYWNIIHPDKDFYAALNALSSDIKGSHPEYSEEDADYLVNIQIGTQIAKKFNEKFVNEEIEIEGFTQKDAYKTKISPFKKALSNRFAQNQIKQEMTNEFEFFKKILNKTQIIITTNYDQLVEYAYNDVSDENLNIYVGQRGFFEQTFGWAELYKIHGCISEPGSIIIDEDDYAAFDNNSVLISAKIISMLLHSPIIFMGYSLSDKNIRKIIKDFSSSMTPHDIKTMSSRIIIVEWDENEEGISEQIIHDRDLECEYTLISVADFTLVYEYLIKVDQGVHPAEVRKYQNIIKQLIVDSGQKGSLNTLLLSPQELDDIEKIIGNDQLVVALGDKAYIFAMPDLMTYTLDYFYGKKEIHTDIALRFLATQQPKSRIPFLKHVQEIELDRTNLNADEKEKVRQRIENFSDLEGTINTVPKPYRIDMESLDEILEEDFRREKEIELICYNFLSLGFSEVEAYIEKHLMRLKEVSVNKFSTAFRRLLLIYDLYKNKKD